MKPTRNLLLSRCRIPANHTFAFRNKTPDGIKSLNDLDVLRDAGQGAFGKVRVVSIKKSEGEEYALKELELQRVITDGIMDQVLAERDVLFEVGSHPYIVKLFSFWKTNQSLYFLMEFVGGGDMFDYVRNNSKIPYKEAGRYVFQMAQALDFLGKNGIIYRDLKLENVLLSTKNGKRSVHLADFGLAKDMKKSTESKTKTVCGTIQYMAPEILRSEAYSHAVDWWSLGVLGYLMVVGRYPYAKGLGKLAFDRSEGDRNIMCTVDSSFFLSFFFPLLLFLLSILMLTFPGGRRGLEHA